MAHRQSPYAEASLPSWAGHGKLGRSLLALLPVWLAYDLAILIGGPANHADAISRALFSMAGHRPLHYVLLHATIAVAVLVWMNHRGERLRDMARNIVPLALEGVIYGAALLALAKLAGAVLPLGPTAARLSLVLGAGLHEELLFRLGVMSALVMFFGGLGAQLRNAVALAALLSALAFAYAHHAAPHGEPFAWLAFTQRTLAGVGLATIYWQRSLAHAVYAHVAYDALWLLL